MNNMNVLISNNSTSLFNECIKRVGLFCDDLSFENVIIVPDRLSLITEQKIFELLNVDVYFNISVMGISKFASKIIKENNLNFIECTNLQSKLLTLKAIQNTKENFNCFSKHYTLGFVDEIYAKIEQIKSSNINIEDLSDDNASLGTKLKFNDLKLIYNEYERLRGERLDSGSLLSMFNHVATSSNYLKKCNVFFVGFDSMTRQGIEVLKNVVKNSHYTLAGVVAPKNQPNAHVYDQSFLTSIINVCKSENFESKMEWLDAPLKNTTANKILNNIFSRKNKFEENNYINLYKASNPTEEIDFLVKSINYALKTKDEQFKNFAICAPASYHQDLKTKLSAVGIDSYFDEKTQLVNLPPVKYLLNFLNHIKNPSDIPSLKQIISSEFCPLENQEKYELLNLVDKLTSINTIIATQADLNNNIKNYLLNLNKFTASLKSILKNYNTTLNYIEMLNNIIKNYNIFEKINLICEKFKSLGEISLEKTYIQIENKLSNIISQINEIIGGHEMELDDFIDIFEKAVTDCEISGIPSTINQVFIGDTKSFYGNVKYLYIVGANEGVMPEALADTGLISDKEISSESIKAILEPTTQIINKRNKFKTLEVLVSAKEKCYLVYHSMDNENKTLQPSDFITELQFLLNAHIVNISSLKQTSESEPSALCFNSINTYNANLNLRSGISDIYDSITTAALIKTNNLFFKPIIKKCAVDFNKLFLENKKISISLVEKYNACPKSAFLANGLKLQKKQRDKIEANIIGSFIHEVAEKFVKTNKSQLGTKIKTQIEEDIEIIAKDVCNKSEFYSLALEENSFILKMLKNECVRFCSFINYEQMSSSFKATYTEKYFGNNSEFKPLTINVDGEDYFVSGIVDRIDINDDYFRIIDYKTGNTTNSKGNSHLFYGTKIQLFVYAEAIKENVNKKLFGAFYLPIKNNFTTKNAEEYSLSGFFIRNTELALKADHNLSLENKKSKILNCSLNNPDKSGEVLISKKDNIVAPETLDSFGKYAISAIKKAIKNISGGYISCSPFKDKCKLCEFNEICAMAHNDKIEREEDYNIENEAFSRIDYDK